MEVYTVEEKIDKHLMYNLVKGDLSKYKDFSIAEVCRWSLDRDYYKEAIEKSNIGIFITYMPNNYDKESLFAFVMGKYYKNILEVYLLCAKKVYKKYTGLGEFLLYKLYEACEPERMIIDSVEENTTKYYEKISYVITEKTSETRYGDCQYNMEASDKNLKRFFDERKDRINKTVFDFLNDLETNDELRNNALSSA